MNTEYNYYPITPDDSNQVSSGVDPDKLDKIKPNTEIGTQKESNIVPTGGGSVMSGGSLKSPNYSVGVSGWKIDSDGNVEFNAGTFRGALAANSIDIPDTTTANSFHVDSTGNTWWGATTLAGSSANVLNTGVATFTNVLVNNSQVLNQDVFGDGSDGDVTISADTNLSSDMFYNNLTIQAGWTLNPNGYRIFVRNTLTTAATGVVARNGNAGGNGTNGTSYTTNQGTGGAAGTALADGSVKGAIAGTAGVDGVVGKSQIPAGTTNGNVGNTGSAGTSVAKSLADADGISGTAGGKGGNGTTVAHGTGTGGNGGTGGGGGTRTGTIYNLVHNSYSAYRLYDDNGTAYFTAAPSNGSGGSGGSGGVSSPNSNTCASGATGGSGGSGGQGGIVPIFARVIVNAGTISANGGAGGDAGTPFTSLASGANDGAGGSAGSAGGDGGNGGIILLVYSKLTNTGTIAASGGAAGSKSSGRAAATNGTGTGTSGADGADGTAGNDGVIIQLQV